MESEFEPSPAAAELLARNPDRYSSLSHEQWLFLIYGDAADRDDCPFESAADAEAMWAVHRRLLLMSYRNSGRRPVAWYCLERPEVAWRGHDKERSTLYQAGALEQQERNELVAWWRAEFAKAESLDADARQKHLAWADVPKSLQRQWKRERRRRGRMIREPEVTVDQSPPAA